MKADPVGFCCIGAIWKVHFPSGPDTTKAAVRRSHGSFHPILQSPAAGGIGNAQAACCRAQSRRRSGDVAARRAGKSRRQSPAQRGRECAGSYAAEHNPEGGAGMWQREELANPESRSVQYRSKEAVFGDVSVVKEEAEVNKEHCQDAGHTGGAGKKLIVSG